MADFRINISLDESSSSLENSSFKDRNARTVSQSSKVSSAIILIDDSDDEPDTATIAESEKENQEDLNDLEEVNYFHVS